MKSSNQHGGSSMICNGYRFETDFQTPAGSDWVTERLGIDEVACCCGSKLRSSSSSSRIFKRFISSFRTP